MDPGHRPCQRTPRRSPRQLDEPTTCPRSAMRTAPPSHDCRAQRRHAPSRLSGNVTRAARRCHATRGYKHMAAQSAARSDVRAGESRSWRARSWYASRGGWKGLPCASWRDGWHSASLGGLGRAARRWWPSAMGHRYRGQGRRLPGTLRSWPSRSPLPLPVLADRCRRQVPPGQTDARRRSSRSAQGRPRDSPSRRCLPDHAGRRPRMRRCATAVRHLVGGKSVGRQ